MCGPAISSYETEYESGLSTPTTPAKTLGGLAEKVLVSRGHTVNDLPKGGSYQVFERRTPGEDVLLYVANKHGIFFLNPANVRSDSILATFDPSGEFTSVADLVARRDVTEMVGVGSLHSINGEEPVAFSGDSYVPFEDITEAVAYIQSILSRDDSIARQDVLLYAEVARGLFNAAGRGIKLASVGLTDASLKDATPASALRPIFEALYAAVEVADRQPELIAGGVANPFRLIVNQLEADLGLQRSVGPASLRLMAEAMFGPQA